MPLGQSQSVAVGDKMSPATADVARPESVPAPPAPTREVRLTRKHESVSPRTVLQAARARIREIKAELKRHAKLERELKQLQRLVDAANGKTLAPVRAIETARRAG